ncbi:MAG: alpha/beta hydrolase [Pedosphaera sp.]|nr:alpha/beta hydrolase [Pedosphaera sp.]
MLTAVLLKLVILYGLVVLLVMLLQRRLIYVPTKLSAGGAESLAGNAGLVSWRNVRSELIGWRLPAATASTGAVLVVHGNAGSAADRSYIAGPIRAAGAIDVFILEYPGYGCRPGNPSQRSLIAAGEEALDLLSDRAPLFIVSESIGAGVAAHLAGKYPNRVAGLALLVPYTSMVELGKRQMPFLPVAWMLWDRFDPAKWLEAYYGPVAVVIAGRDEIIPPDLGRRLFDGYSGPKQIEVVTGAGHNDVAEQTPDWWRHIFSFWRSHAAAAHAK